MVKVTDKIILAIAKFHPNTLPVKRIAIMFVAGAVYKNANAGPIPAPFFLIPAKSGRIVHEHTANKTNSI